jgi:Cof subfamily protein (haloacid dehalogenase superfamily)
MYKLICLDMDGTLLNSKGEASKRNVDAIKMAHEKGVKVAVCTGRLFTSARFYADMLGVKVPVIASNGAYIREKDKNEVIYKSVLGFENSKRIFRIFKKHNMTFYFHTYDTVFMEKLNSNNAYLNINKTLPKDKQINIQVVQHWEKAFEEYKEDILKCVCIDENLEKIARVKKELLEFEELEIVSSMNTNIEAMNKGVSKGRAAEILAGFYDLKSIEVMCIGDNENDISMLKYAGMGVAMGNGEDYVKEIADFVTDTNDNDGVAKAIEKFILT